MKDIGKKQSKAKKQKKTEIARRKRTEAEKKEEILLDTEPPVLSI